MSLPDLYKNKFDFKQHIDLTAANIDHTLSFQQIDSAVERLALEPYIFMQEEITDKEISDAQLKLKLAKVYASK